MSEFITGDSQGIGAVALEIKLILCPIDFSEFSERAYQHALSLADHYQAKLVAQHIVELWRHPSASFAASGGLFEEFRQVLCETGEINCGNLQRATYTKQFSRNSWCTRGRPRTLFCRSRKRRKRT